MRVPDKLRSLHPVDLVCGSITVLALVLVVLNFRAVSGWVIRLIVSLVLLVAGAGTLLLALLVVIVLLLGGIFRRW